LLQKALRDDAIPKVYSNGFICAMGAGDTTVAFQLNGKPNMVLNLSYTIAKTLALKLGQMIADIEEKSGRQIMATEEISTYMGFK